MSRCINTLHVFCLNSGNGNKTFEPERLHYVCNVRGQAFMHWIA